jgi:hypothetical protein
MRLTSHSPAVFAILTACLPLFMWECQTGLEAT